jgi:23S rRNA pseudouridine1911/1915/1917 synthase
MTRCWTPDPDEVGIRLDKFLAAPDRLESRGRAREAIERGKVFVNDKEATRADAAVPVAAGAVVRLWIDRPGSAVRRRDTLTESTLRIVYEDDAVIVLDKPAGLLAVPLARQGDTASVYDYVRTHLDSRRRPRPFVVHRIDRDTSGLVVFAKHARAQERLKSQFRQREPERVYWAVVYGHPTPSAGEWRDRLVWDSRALIQKETHRRDPRGKEAISLYRVLETFRDAALVEIRLQTGKRNQIRLQARLRGHMLVGERRYTFGPDRLRTIAFPRQALHAHRLAFRHPTGEERLEFEARLPADFAGLLARLRRSQA